MKRLAGMMAVLSVLVFVLPPCPAAQTADPNILALKGLKTVVVLVDELPPGAAELGLTAEMIKKEAEAKLRQGGLAVPSFSYEDPYLYLKLSVVGEAFSLNVSLREYVELRRDRRIACAAATWTMNVTGVHRRDGSLFIEGLREILDSFLSDLQRANAKKKAISSAGR